MSHIPRLYIDHPLEKGTSVPLEDGQGKYLTRVMRLAAGAIVRAFNGLDGEWRCALNIDGKRVTLIPDAQTRPQMATPNLTLLFAPLKKNRTDFAVEKACELGVRRIQPVMTEYTQTSRVRADKLQAIAVEAAEQTERLDVPEVTDALNLGAALAAWDKAAPLYYCDEGASALPMRDALAARQDTAAGLLVGPEGGFAPREREMLRALDFVIPVTLGPRILRAETAVVSALTLWQSELGDWRERPYLPES